jgi:flagellar protein FlbT
MARPFFCAGLRRRAGRGRAAGRQIAAVIPKLTTFAHNYGRTHDRVVIMALKVELKPGERILIGNVVLRNGDNRARFFIEGSCPILREKDILTEDGADTVARKIYFTVQLMYIANDMSKYQKSYIDLITQFTQAAPSSLAIIADINNLILTDQMYKALKLAKKLIEYEAELMAHAQRG